MTKKIMTKIMIFCIALVTMLVLTACGEASAKDGGIAYVSDGGEVTAGGKETAGVGDGGNNTVTSSDSSAESGSNSDMVGEGAYIDGVYTGTAVGYAGGLKMQVTVEDGFITKVECLSHNEVGKQYYEAAFNDVPALIIEKQSTDGIDAVSGSTMTTKGILRAVDKALKGAKK